MWSYLKSNAYNQVGRTLPGVTAPGGGVRTKIDNIEQAGIPIISMIPLCETFGLLIEPTSLNHHPEYDSTRKGFDLNIEDLEELRAFKACWAEEQQLLRWEGHKRDKFLSKVDAVFVCNNYLKDILRVYVRQPISILRTPIDSFRFRPRSKKKQIVAMGRVSIEKNIECIIEFYRTLPDGWDKIYIGNVDLWGTEPKPIDKLLEGRLKNVCDWMPSLTQGSVAEIAGESWGYINLARYDVGCLSFLEFGMAGAHCFCSNFHLMFDEYDFVNRVYSPAHAVEQIINIESEQGLNTNEAMRQQMIQMHSYEAFREQLALRSMEVTNA